MTNRACWRIAVLGLVLVTAAACETAEPSTPATALAAVAGSSWAVAFVDGQPPIAGAVPTITFGADDVTGTGGCNKIRGRYALDAANGTFAVVELRGTAMGCLQPGVSEFETVFVQALGSANQAALDRGGRLVLSGGTAPVILVPLVPPAGG